MPTNLIPRRRIGSGKWLLMLLPPLCFLVKDIVALIVLLPVEADSESAYTYYFFALLPGTVYTFGTRAIIFNLFVGIAIGLALPRFVTYARRNVGFSIVRGIAGGVIGGALWLSLMIVLGGGGIAGWQWWLIGMIVSFLPFAIVGAVIALGLITIESWVSGTLSVVPRLLFGAAFAAVIRIYSPLASCKPYYEPCTVTGVATDLLLYGITVGAAAAVLAGFRTEKSS